MFKKLSNKVSRALATRCQRGLMLKDDKTCLVGCGPLSLCTPCGRFRLKTIVRQSLPRHDKHLKKISVGFYSCVEGVQTVEGWRYLGLFEKRESDVIVRSYSNLIRVKSINFITCDELVCE